ncbi:MAG: hypothetical protein IPJ30_03860 [Acidobacteria bacterium]|nr:hypothetical protein [Acidobacteriota bacterium]
MKRIIPIFAVSAFLLLCIGSAIAQDDLANKPITIHLKNRSFECVVWTLFRQDIPIGLEESASEKNYDDLNYNLNVPEPGEFAQVPDESLRGFNSKSKRKFTLDFDNAVLTEVLDKFVEQMEGYTWKINDGVVNIFPKSRREAIFEKLLETKISEFRISKGDSFGSMQLEIYVLPEIQDFLIKQSSGVSDTRFDLGHLDRVFKSELVFRDLTLKELLNRITKVKRGGWVVRRDMLSKQKDGEPKLLEILL